MSDNIENIKKIKQIGQNSFLLFFGKLFYFISFEIIEISKIKINIIKIEESETHIFQTIIQFNSLGTEDLSPEDTLQTISFLINSFNFSINEETDKITLMINSKNKTLIELLLYKENKDNSQTTRKKEYINNIQNKIKNLLNIISNQEQRINDLKNREENHKNMLNKIEQITSNINKQIENESNNNYNNDRNNNQYNPYKNPYNNPYNSPYNQYNNNIRNNNSFTNRNLNYDGNSMIGNINNNNLNITINTKVVYNPYLPDNTNINNLLTRPEYKPFQPKPKVEKIRTINLDQIDNYKP